MCGSRTLAECLVLWFCVSLLCDRHRPSSVHPYCNTALVSQSLVGLCFAFPLINQSITVRAVISCWFKFLLVFKTKISLAWGSL